MSGIKKRSIQSKKNVFFFSGLKKTKQRCRSFFFFANGLRDPRNVNLCSFQRM